VETARRFITGSDTRLGAYLGLQRALMRRFVARGGTPEDFCARLAPAFCRRYAPLLLEAGPQALADYRGGASLRVRSQEPLRRAA
jgi:hypothetical protein